MSNDYIAVLNHIKAGQWHQAHDIVQSRSDVKACLIHAHLHRVEGDLSNARYWYRRAEEPMPTCTLEDELNHLYEIL